MNKENFNIGMRILVGTFPDKSFDMKVYWEFLKDMDDKAFIWAIKDICSTIAEIYPNTNIIALIRAKGLNRYDLTAGEAWAVVLATVSSVGGYGKPRFTDPLIAKAVDCIGWKDICRSEKIGIERSHFIKVFDQLKERDNKDKLLLPEVKQDLLGIDKIKKLTKGVGE